jgi:diaminohydroxyphosphoribosylaminopyrimidine deaminase/5-amino-6-(5-phosphoribosylamino)uracil reductase
MAGIGTVISDDPLLTCRLPGLEMRSPVRIVVDSKLRLPPDSQLVRTARTSPLIVFTSAQSGGDDLIARGVEIERVSAGDNGLPALPPVLKVLAGRGITRLLVEGGPRLHASLMKSGLADLVHLFVAPRLLGAAGLPGIGQAWQPELISAGRLRLMDRVNIGPDTFETLAFGN